jgi:hypothetical protein
MDDFYDQQLKEQLSRGPFPRGGFDDRLRNKIMERIDQDNGRPAGSRKAFLRAAARAATAFAAFVLLVGLGMWIWQDRSEHSPVQEALAPSPAAEAPMFEPKIAFNSAQRYALLIGLRTDRQEDSALTTSRYRTVLVAPDENPAALRLVTDNPGLYMPYGQNFWLIDAVSSADGRQRLQAVQATNRRSPSPDHLVTIPDYLLSERLLYAGNRYVSVQSTVTDPQGAVFSNMWVKHIEQINAPRQDPATEPHAALQDVVKSPDSSVPRQEQWSIARAQGKWVAESPQGDAINVNLPDTVIQNDNLLMSWEEIRRIEPGARDAFTYGNMLGVVTDRDIRVHAIRNGASVSASPVTIPLAEGESLVMVQWAQDPYVDRWTEALRALRKG